MWHYTFPATLANCVARLLLQITATSSALATLANPCEVQIVVLLQRQPDSALPLFESRYAWL